MKIKKSDMKLVVLVIFLALALVSYLYCNTTLSEKTAALEAENTTLSAEVSYLQDLMNHKQEYVDDTEEMKVEIEEIQKKFPADVKAETQIMYANRLELSNAILVTQVQMPGKELVVVTDPATVAATDATATDATATDATATDATAVTDDTTAVAAGSSLSATVLLYRNPTTIDFKATYKSIKDVIKAINTEDADKKSIESLDLAYDKETGNLIGTLVVDMYSMDGTESEYVIPNISGVKNGSNNIFQTSENVAALRTTTTDTEGNPTEEGSEAEAASDDAE